MLSIIAVLLTIALAALRLVEAIYQLRQKPGLNTLQKCWQVLVNFVKVETYPTNDDLQGKKQLNKEDVCN